MKSLLLAAASLAAMSGVAWAQGAPPPASAFGRIPAVRQAAIAPGGKTIAILGGVADERTLSFATIDQPGLPVVQLGKVEAVGIRWAGDGFVLARIAYWEKVGAKNAYRFERNISVTPDGKPVARLLEGDMASQFLVTQPILAITAAPNRRAIMLGLQNAMGPSGGVDTRLQRKGERDDFQTALWSVDPSNGKGVLVEHGGSDTSNWDVDLTGQPRVRVEVNDVNHSFTLMGRAKTSTRWQTLLSNPDEETWRTYYGYSDPDDAIYLLAASAEGDQLTRRRLSDGVVEPFGRPVKGLNSYLIWDEERGTAVAVAADQDKPDIQWMDPELGAIHGALSRAFKGKQTNLESWSADRTRFVVRVNSPDAPGAWYLFDKPRKELSPLGDEYPELKDAAFGTTKWITYKARDGLEIPAYVTLPPGAPASGGKLPLIVLPHGGPTARDDVGFDWLTQFLATRGYVVIRSQFRGSWGFGRDFEMAGRGEWGGKVQTDLLDGIAYLGADGTIDPARVCVVGASFGGYAALAGATLHPEAYRCAASIAGISDLGMLIGEEMRAYGRDSGGLRSLRRMLADAGSAKLRDTSPLQQVAAVRAPILLVHADQDTIVPLEQSQKMADALQGAGKPMELVVLKGEDHYLSKSATRTQMLETLGAFLAKNLPVKP